MRPTWFDYAKAIGGVLLLLAALLWHPSLPFLPI